MTDNLLNKTINLCLALFCAGFLNSCKTGPTAGTGQTNDPSSAATPAPAPAPAPGTGGLAVAPVAVDPNDARVTDVNVISTFTYKMVNLFYQGILWRSPDFPAANVWVSAVHFGSILGVADTIANSPEFKNIVSSKTRQEVIEHLYLTLLERNIDPTGTAIFVKGTMPISQVVDLIVASEEFVQHWHSTQNSVRAVDLLYQTVLWRGADFPGANGWVAQVYYGHLADAANQIFASGEFTNGIAPKGRQTVINHFYEVLLGREIDPNGIDVFVKGTMSYATVVSTIAVSDEFQNRMYLAPAQQPSGHVNPSDFTLAQIRDMQGDLMLWVPSLKPNYVNGVDPVTNIRQRGDNGATAHGLEQGWVWTLNVDRYPKEKREIIYQAALSSGYTHFAIQVTKCTPGEGYHALMPVTDADCVGADDKLNTILHEIWDHKLIPLCTGVSPTDPVAPGLDKSLCRIVLNDWDNSDQADCHIKVLAETFPNAQIVFELPGGAITPKQDSCSSVPFPTSGGEWIRKAQQRWPNFFAVAYETNQPDGLDQNVAELTQEHAFWRDVQEIRFETDTYWKFWDNLDPNTAKKYNDDLQARVPWLKGYMSGGTPHTPPSGGTVNQGGFVGELDLTQAKLMNMAGDFAAWPVTTHITRVELGNDYLHVTMDNGRPDSWPDTADRPGMGPLLYTLGIAEQINGVWYASAPIQLWRGLDGGGGSIQVQDIGDGRGQIQANWFYDSRWGIMSTYQPKIGETIGIFVCAGDCRDANGNFSPVHERSNVVLVKLPNPGEAVIIGK